MKVVLAFWGIFLCHQAQAEFQTDTRPFSIIGGTVDGMTILKTLPFQNGLRQLGVEKDDVVVAADYQPVLNTQAAMQAYHAKHLQSVSISFLWAPCIAMDFMYLPSLCEGGMAQGCMYQKTCKIFLVSSFAPPISFGRGTYGAVSASIR